MFRDKGLTGSNLISRKRKVDTALAESAQCDGIIISAQAGQGKSIFASLLAEKVSDFALVYQITEKDRDPIHLCISLHKLFKDNITGYHCDVLEELILGRTMTVFEYSKYISIAASALNEVSGKLCIIIDDTHILPDDGLGFHCLNTFINKLNFNIIPLICSRQAVNLKSEKTFYVIDKDILSLDKSEFMMLCNSCLGWLDDFSCVERVQEISEGWMMGVRLIFDYMTSRKISDIKHVRSMDDVISLYFDSIGGDAVPDKKGTMRMLALMEDFHRDMLADLPDGKAILLKLDEMHRQNFFVYDVGGDRYKFHQLFAEYLFSGVEDVFSQNDINQFLKSAARFEITKGEYAKALKYLSDAGDIVGIEETMKESLADIRGLSSASYIFQTVEKSVKDSNECMPYTKLFLGMQAEQDGRDSAFKYLHASAEDSCSSAEYLCEALAFAGLVRSLAYIGGDFQLAASYHLKLLESYDKLSDIHPEYELLINTALAVGAIFTYGSVDPLPFLKKVDELNRKLKNFNAEFSALTLKTMWAQFNSDSKALSEGGNSLYKIYGSNVSNLITDVFCIGHIINHYGTMGELSYLYDVCCKMIDTTPSPILKVFITTWLADNLLADGDADGALEIINNFYAENSAPDHPDSQLLHTKALILAVQGKYKDAIDLIDIFIQKRHNSGAHKFFYSLSYSFAAQIYALAGDMVKAEEYVEKSMAEYSSAAFDGKNKMTLSYICSETGRDKEAEVYGVESIKDFRSENIQHFWGVIREISMTALRYAVKHEEVSQYASDFAKERYRICLKPKLEIPYMMINTLGKLEITCGDKKAVAGNFSGVLYSMLAMLLFKGENCASVQSVMGTLWGDAPDSNARNSFDATVSRLRNIFKNELGVDPKLYLAVKNGQISLRNVIVDAGRFIELVKTVRKQYVAGKLIESFMNLRKAKSIYNGEYLSGYFGSTDIAEDTSSVESAFFTMVSHMLYHEDKMKGHTGLDKVVRERIKHIMKDQETFRRVICHYRNKGENVFVLQMLNKYEEFLRENDFDEYEISRAIFELKK